MKILRKLASNLFDLVFPVECLGCRKDGVFVCDECLRGVKLKKDFPCVVCGREAFFGRTHRECSRETSIDGVLCATDYKDELVGKMIRTYKYNLVRDLGPSLGWVMMRYLRGLMGRGELSKQRARKEMLEMTPEFLRFFTPSLVLPLGKGEITNRIVHQPEKPVLIPVPLHARRLRERGFNQAEILAGELSKYFDWDVQTDILTRKKYTTAQVNLKADERARNIKNAFDNNAPAFAEATAGKKTRKTNLEIKNRTVILVDDVLTTGATLNEAGMVLKNMGAREVWGVCLAKD
ncbi:ComF family protein [Candidatus Falkowbacteria bacterium]|nr:ComF family protein [Candidatus Falkowbacteria bacterium]